MKETSKKIIPVGKDNTNGLQTPRFRLHIHNDNADDVFVVHYGLSVQEVNSPPHENITNVYNIVDILNECIDDYHDRHRED